MRLLIYFATFAVSGLLSYVSEFNYKQDLLRGRKKSPGWMVFAAMAVLSVSVLNGIRDYTIGTDVLYYGNKTFEISYLTNSFSEYINYCITIINMHEPGYAFLNWAVSRFSHSPHVFYFVLGLMINGFAYGTACRCRQYCPVVLSWLGFLFLSFPTSLNLLRQGLAVVIVSYAFAGLSKTGWKWYLFWIAMAWTIHQSAVIAAIYLPLYLQLTSNQEAISQGDIKEHRALTPIIVFIICVAAASNVFDLLDNMGALPGKYAHYLDSSVVEKQLTNAVLIRLPFVLLALWLILVHRNNMDAVCLCLATFIVGEFALLPLQNVSDAVFRISLYFSIFKMIGYPSILYQLKIPKWVTISMYFAYIIFIFCYQVIYSGNGEVYPFVIASDIL